MTFVFSAMKIHVSPVTKSILDKFGTYQLELRGDVEMKVGGGGLIFYMSVIWRGVNVSKTIFMLGWIIRFVLTYWSQIYLNLTQF